MEITGAGIGAVIPLSADVAGTAEPSDWDNAETHTRPSGNETASSSPSWYYVVVLAGQSNGMAYGEGLPLPETYDRPEPRIMQLARRSTVTPGGKACQYNDIILADHCLHDVQDMSGKNHPKADVAKGQYGTVGQGLHIAKKLLPFIPADAGILLVPCCRGGSAFTAGADGTYSDSTGASEDSARWGVDKPLYKDLISRTKAALAKNPKNRLLAVVWMQGEFDIDAKPTEHSALFLAMVEKFRADLAEQAEQCTGGSAAGVPWICGDTTYFWKQKNEPAYQAIYGGYKNKTDKNIHFVPLMTDENDANVPTNNPAEDPDIESIGYYGSTWRNSAATWTSADRASHFSSWARRGIISDRLATAVLTHAGRTTVKADVPSSETEAPVPSPSETEAVTTTLLSYRVSESEGNLKAQGWEPAGGKAEIISDAGGTGGKAMKLTKETGKSS
ncbi:sialate O-acetylesterase, partial [Escherichia coli]|nr:sialate O-acetylesterase [Escherichia coli]